MLKKDSDYVTMLPLPGDEVYFGPRYSGADLKSENVEVLAKIIDSVVKAQNGKGNFAKGTNGYKYQIISAVNTNGHLLSRVQAICKEETIRIDWKREFQVKDGGDCFFSFIYDFTTKQVSSFNINGEA